MENIASLGSALAAMRPSEGGYDSQLMRSALPAAPVDDRLSLGEWLLHWFGRVEGGARRDPGVQRGGAQVRPHLQPHA